MKDTYAYVRTYVRTSKDYLRPEIRENVVVKNCISFPFFFSSPLPRYYATWERKRRRTTNAARIEKRGKRSQEEELAS